MRLRLQTFLPLPQVKAWFTTDGLVTPLTVTDLKALICENIPALKRAGFEGSHIALVLDDFELLDDSPFSTVRDNDLIHVRLAPSSDLPLSASLGKRKRADVHATSTATTGLSTKDPKTKTLISQPSTDLPLEDDESSHSDSDVSVTSSSSEEESTSEESSSEESLSAAEDSLSVKNNTAKRQRLELRPSINKTTPVPPGFGKPSTHSRNARRRRKRIHDKVQPQSESNHHSFPPESSSSVNVVPLGQRQAAQESTDANAALGVGGPASGNALPTSNGTQASSNGEPIMMLSLRNKNKKKNFRQAMAGSLPPKIIFSDKSETQPSPDRAGGLQPKPGADTAESTEHFAASLVATRPPLVPPSELQARGELPSNIVVTSVDVEADIWDHRGKRKKKRKGEANGERYVPDPWAEETGSQFEDAIVDEEPSASKPSDSNLEKLWENGEEVKQPDQLAVGLTAGWYHLGINYSTLTPENMLKVARIVGITGDEDDPRFVVQPTPGPWTESFVSVHGKDGDPDEVVEETYSWAEVLGAHWRIMPIDV